MSMCDSIIKQADGVFRFIRENLNKENLSEDTLSKYTPYLIERLNAFINQYKEVTGTNLLKGEEMLAPSDYELWKDMLDMFRETGEIIWNLDKKFPDSEKELTEEFGMNREMTELKLLLAGIILIKVKKKKEKKNDEIVQKKEAVEKKDLRGIGFKSSRDVFEKFERFVNNNVPDFPEQDENFTEKGELKKQIIENYKHMMPWYIIYHTAQLELDEKNIAAKAAVNKDMKALLEHKKMKREQLIDIVKYYYNYEKQKDNCMVR